MTYIVEQSFAGVCTYEELREYCEKHNESFNELPTSNGRVVGFTYVIIGGLKILVQSGYKGE